MTLNVPIAIYKPYLPPPVFERLEPREARSEVEGYLTLLNEVWEERDRQILLALQQSITGGSGFLAADGTAAAPQGYGWASDLDTGHFHPADNQIAVSLGGVEEYRFTPAAFQPAATGVNTLGTGALGFQTIYADNNGGVVFQLPDAAQQGAATSYELFLGGGGLDGGIALITMSDVDASNPVGIGNDFILDLGAISQNAGNRFIMRSNTAATAGLVQFIIGFNGLGSGSAGGVAFRLSNDSVTPLSLGFVNATSTSATPQFQEIYFAHVQQTGSGLERSSLSLRQVSRSGVSGANTAIRGFVNLVPPEESVVPTTGGNAPSRMVWMKGSPFSDANFTNVSANKTQLANVEIGPPIVTLNGGVVVPLGTSLYITAAPTFGTTANYAAWVDAGDVRLDGNLLLGVTTAATTGTRLSSTAAGVLTLVGVTSGEDLTFDFTVANTVTVASSTAVADLILNITRTRVTNLDLSTAARLSAAAGVLTMAGLGGTPEDLTFDLSGTSANIVTVASTTGVTDLVFSFANVRTTTALEIDGNLNHDGASIGFFGGGLAGQGAAYTQTYATADRTHAALTSAVLTDSTTGGAPNQDVAVVDATGANLTTNSVINDNFRELLTQTNALRVDIEDVKQLVNAIIDDLQSWGMVA